MAVQKNKECGFTIAEMLVALAVMALLLTAVAVAFNAAVINYTENSEIFNAINTGRQAMLRMTNQFRTAGSVTAEGISRWSDEPFTDRCSFTPCDSNLPFSGQFRYYATGDATHIPKSIYVKSNGNDYLLCDHVSAMTFSRQPTTGTVTSVQMSMTVTVGDNSQTVAGAVVLRKAL